MFADARIQGFTEYAWRAIHTAPGRRRRPKRDLVSANVAPLTTGDKVDTWLGEATITDTGYLLTLNMPDGPTRVEITPPVNMDNRRSGTFRVLSTPSTEPGRPGRT